MEGKLVRMVNMTFQKKKRLRSFIHPELNAGFLSSIFPSLSKSSESEVIKSDIANSELVLRQLFISLDEMNYDLARARDYGTWKGLYTNLMGYVFSFYCIFKVATSAFGVVFTLLDLEIPLQKQWKQLRIIWE